MLRRWCISKRCLLIPQAYVASYLLRGGGERSLGKNGGRATVYWRRKAKRARRRRTEPPMGEVMNPADSHSLETLPTLFSLGQSSGNLERQRMSVHSAQVKTGVGPKR